MRRPKGTNSTIEKQIATHVEKYTIDIAGRMPRIEFPDSIGLCQCLRGVRVAGEPENTGRASATR